MLASALRDELLLWPSDMLLADVPSPLCACGDNVRDMVARLRARECALPNPYAFCHLRVLIRLTHCVSPRLVQWVRRFCARTNDIVVLFDPS